LGLEEAQQVSRDPLCGNLFENMVVAEMFKHYYHHGRRPRLSFYRDSTGNEVDLLVQHGRELAAVDIKSGQTVTRDYFQGLNRFDKVAGDRLTGGAVVYGGDKRQLRSDWEVWPVAELDRLAFRASSLFVD